MSEDYIEYNYERPAAKPNKTAKSKQTAVEWLIDQLRQLAHNQSTHLGMGDIRVTQGMLDDFEEQAKQMEKEQIEDAHIEGQRVFDKYPHTEWTNNQAEIHYEKNYAK